MFKKILLVFVFAICATNLVFAAEKNSQAETWNSVEGLKKLENSQFKNDFYQLVNFYQPQENPLYCSIATATIISNALDYGKIPSQKESEIIKPKQAGGGVIEFHLYLQKTFFNAKTQKIKKRAVIEFQEPITIGEQKIYDAGISLGDFAKMLSQAHNFKIKVTYAKKNDVKSIEKFRITLKEILADKENFIVANFDGRVIGTKTEGHISPLVAYDEASDSILVLDVALHKNQWYWINLEKLYEAMNTKDAEKYRGYLLISR